MFTIFQGRQVFLLSRHRVIGSLGHLPAPLAPRIPVICRQRYAPQQCFIVHVRAPHLPMWVDIGGTGLKIRQFSVV